MSQQGALAVGAAQQGVKAVIPTKDRTGNGYVFFAMDTIDGLVKGANPDWLPGGVLRPECMTLGHRNGYVRRCEITVLRPRVVSERASFIQPEERKHLPPIVNLEDEQGNVTRLGMVGVKADGKTTTASLGKEAEIPDGLLRTVFYPADEIDRLTGQVDGLVRMPVLNGQQAAEAQYFLFPDWDDIVNGTKELPHRAQEMAAYFKERRNQASNDWERQVATAALKSVEDYTSWGTKLTTRANTEFRAMQTKGYAAPYGADAEAAFDQLGVQRQDTIQQQQSDKLDKLTDSISRFVEASLSQTSGGAPKPATTEEDLAEFFAWKADQAKAATAAAEAEAAAEQVETVGNALREGLVVNVEGQPATVVHPKGAFGKVEVKLLDGTKKLVAKEKIALIPEDNDE